LNKDTLVAVCCYRGDQHQVIGALPEYLHHECPVVVFSPKDQPAEIPGVLNVNVGQACYIGALSLMRQVEHLMWLREQPQNFFLLHDSDSLCLSKEIPEHLYRFSQNTIWSNEIVEPRPHPSPYPKLAFQPPYFLSRNVIERMLGAAHKPGCHEITPYIDWFMNACSAEAGLEHMPFTALEHAPRTEMIFSDSDPWRILEHRIRYYGTSFVHPIKTEEQRNLCRAARKFYESR
jgi:hypothetical protein